MFYALLYGVNLKVNLSQASFNVSVLRQARWLDPIELFA